MIDPTKEKISVSIARDIALSTIIELSIAAIIANDTNEEVNIESLIKEYYGDLTNENKELIIKEIKKLFTKAEDAKKRIRKELSIIL